VEERVRVRDRELKTYECIMFASVRGKPGRG